MSNDNKLAAALPLDAELAQDRLTELRKLERDVLDSVPAVYYMDPPDGGNVSLGEQVKRMAEDAALWRKHSSTPAAPGIDLEQFRSVALAAQDHADEYALDDVREDADRLLRLIDDSQNGGKCCTCEGHGMIGGLLPAGGGYDSEPCPDCSPKGGSDAPDMFWNDADPERAFDSIIELVSREWSNGSVVAGDVMEIQQAIRLPNIKVRVVESEDDGVDYEEAPNTPSVCPKCSGTGFVECGKSGPFVRSGSIQCGGMQATSAEVGA